MQETKTPIINYEELWTRDTALQKKLRGRSGYLGKLALMANRVGTESPFSLNSSKVNRKKFSGSVPFLNVSSGKIEDSLLTYNGFHVLSRQAEKRQSRYEGPQIGSSLELFFMDVSHKIFGDSFVGEISATLDDLNYQTDAIFLEQPFGKTQFLFGLDFTIDSSNNIYRDSGVEKKIRQIIHNIEKEPEKFNVIYVDDRQTDEKLSAKNVPKLVCYINAEILERLAEHYYKLEHEKLLNLLSKIRLEIIESLAMQAYILAKYAKIFHKPELFNSYYLLYRKLKLLTRKEGITLNRKSPVVGNIDDVLHTVNPKRMQKKIKSQTK